MTSGAGERTGDSPSAGVLATPRPTVVLGLLALLALVLSWCRAARSRP